MLWLGCYTGDTRGGGVTKDKGKGIGCIWHGRRVYVIKSLLAYYRASYIRTLIILISTWSGRTRCHTKCTVTAKV